MYMHMIYYEIYIYINMHNRYSITEHLQKFITGEDPPNRVYPNTYIP